LRPASAFLALSATPTNDKHYRVKSRTDLTMEVSAWRSLSPTLAWPLDAGCDVPVAAMSVHIKLGVLVSFLTDICCPDPDLTAQLFREPRTAQTEQGLPEIHRSKISLPGAKTD
jgi:hypothetical protein